jgi:hypothetical protein
MPTTSINIQLSNLSNCAVVRSLGDRGDILKYCTHKTELQSTQCSDRNEKTKLHGLSPRANYTDRATAACRRSYCQLFVDTGCHVVSVTDYYGRILGFLDRSRYFSIK